MSVATTRSQYQTQIRVVKNGGRINSDSFRGTADDVYVMGTLLTNGVGNRLLAIPGVTIDATLTVPVKAIAIEAYDGTDGAYVPIQEINADTVLEGQMYSGAATNESARYGTLVRDVTTGHYAVVLGGETNAAIEVVDIEPEYQPCEPRAAANYNKVWFRFLPDMLDVVPADESGS